MFVILVKKTLKQITDTSIKDLVYFTHFTVGNNRYFSIFKSVLK